MRKKNKIIALLLLIIGTFFLCAGCIAVLRRIDDTKQTMQIPHTSTDVESSTSDTSIQTSEGITQDPESIATEEASSNTETVESSESILTTDSYENSFATESLAATESIPAEESYLSPYADYFVQYPDIAAWFQIPDTNIDYPVMWTPEDETYYLYRHYDGSDNINGSLLLDTDSSLSPLTTNLIIHGHNMKSGAMFGNLPKYADKDYYEQHKEMLLYTPEGEHRYEIIAVFRSQVYKKTDTVFKYYKFFQADTEAEFQDFYDNIKALSLYDTGVTAEFGDNFITLSTCVSYVERGRFVVVAKEITTDRAE